MAPHDTTRGPFELPYSAVRVDEQVGAFLRGVYSWMTAGLALTAIIAWSLASSPGLAGSIAINRPLFWAIVVAQLGLVLALSARVGKLAPATASMLFLVYSRRKVKATSFSSVKRELVQLEVRREKLIECINDQLGIEVDAAV